MARTLFAAAIVALTVFASISVAQVSIPSPPVADAVAKGFRLLRFSPTDAQWVAPAQLDRLRFGAEDVNYMDITEDPEPPQAPQAFAPVAYPTTPRQQRIVRPLLAMCAPERVGRIIAQMESYYTRYYTEKSSREAVVWLKAEYERVAALHGRLGNDTSAELFEHDWEQPSLIVTVKGTTLPDEIVVLGGHIDSIGRGGAAARAPGADDDASGSANVFDAFAAMMAGDFRPKRTVQFMAYAAEEVGLLGSRDIAKKYAATSRNVVAMYQAEMSGYIGNSYTINIITDFTDEPLNKFLYATIKEYLDIDYVSSNCGYACSDHAPWTEVGYKAVMAMEKPVNQLNPKMHSDQDLLENLDMVYSVRFSQLALAFAVELAQF